MALVTNDTDEQLQVDDSQVDSVDSFEFSNETETKLPVAELVKLEGDGNQEIQRQQLGELENSNLEPNIPSVGKPDVNINTAPEYRVYVDSGFNPIRGTPNSETINGTNNDDIIAALGGDDKVYGLAGNDAISGGSGNDYVEGNIGNDQIYGDFAPSGNSSLIGIGNDTLYGNEGKDSLFGQNGTDFLDGGSGNDNIEGGNNNDTIYGGTDNDVLYGDDFEQSPAVSGDDLVYGGAGSDKIYGGRGKDSLFGENGNDNLFGGQSNDLLSGGNGKDKLVGTDTDFFGQIQLGFGVGEIDTLTGGGNNDTFVLGLAEANARDADGNDTVVKNIVLYNDSNINAAGINDYALITDFGFVGDAVPRGIDKIQLTGTADMYTLGSSPIGSASGTGVFLNQGQSTPELIGVVQGISPTSLNLLDANQFVFV
jgi:Ca2+-binding RTX toxin-like protein